MFRNVQISRGTVIFGAMEMFYLSAIKENTRFLKLLWQRDKSISTQQKRLGGIWLIYI